MNEHYRHHACETSKQLSADKSIEILLQEYRTLREEILTSMASRNSILAFGLATVGVLYTAAAQMGHESVTGNLSHLILILVLPFVCFFISLSWLGEYERIQRAGGFIARLEKRINDLAAERLLSWETELRMKKKHMNYPYHAILTLLTLLGLLSFGIGLYRWTGFNRCYLLYSCSALMVELVLFLYLSYKIRTCQGRNEVLQSEADEKGIVRGTPRRCRHKKSGSESPDDRR